MSTIQLYIRFVLRTFEQNVQGLAPISCRLTYNKKRKDFSTGITINPDCLYSPILNYLNLWFSVILELLNSYF